MGTFAFFPLIVLAPAGWRWSPKLTPQGSWGGKGLKKRKTTNPRFLLKTAGTEAAARKDFGQSNVIISERSERKAKQFLPKDLPYPYTSVAQYQASLAQPVGGEWNSRTAVQRETMPRVIKKVSSMFRGESRGRGTMLMISAWSYY
jgi:U3 small nucleolar RNA-associated protein 14